MQTGAKTFFAQPQQDSQLAAILVHHLERQASCPQEGLGRGLQVRPVLETASSVSGLLLIKPWLMWPSKC